RPRLHSFPTRRSSDLEPYPWHQHPNVTVVMDFKLPGSGEFGSFNFDNLQWLQEKDAVKFVVKDRHDFETAVDLLNADHFGKLLRSEEHTSELQSRENL